MRPVIWPKEKKLWLPGRRALLTGLGALAAGGLLTRKQARAVTITSSSAPTPPFRRNLLRRNGGMEIWQRGAGGSASFSTAAGSPIYTADGWYVNASGAQVSTVSQVAGLTNGSQWALKYQRNAGQSGVATQVLGFPLDTDEIYPMLGQSVILSFTAKAGANLSGVVAVQLDTGDGTPVKFTSGYTNRVIPINPGAISLTTTPVRYQFTSTVIVPTSTRQAEVIFQFTPVGTAGADDSFTIDDLKLEVVPDQFAQATEFDRYEFTEELLLCQRHFFKTFQYVQVPVQNAGTGGSLGGSMYVAAATSRAVNGDFHYPVPMRVVPTITTFNTTAANAEVRDITGAVDCSTFVPTANFPNALNFAATGNAASVAGNRWNVHITADAGI